MSSGVIVLCIKTWLGCQTEPIIHSCNIKVLDCENRAGWTPRTHWNGARFWPCYTHITLLISPPDTLIGMHEQKNNWASLCIDNLIQLLQAVHMSRTQNKAFTVVSPANDRSLKAIVVNPWDMGRSVIKFTVIWEQGLCGMESSS